MSEPAVRVHHVDSIPLAVIRGSASASELPRVVPDWCGRVWNELRSQQLRGGRNVALYWDSAIRLEVGVEMPGEFAQGAVVRSATPAGTVASVTHLGPYARLGTAHAAIREWCGKHHHRLSGPNWEIYGHWQSEWDARPSEIRTDVFYLLAPTLET